MCITTVVAAVIERDGKILVGQRRRGDRHPLKWEFPGGKLEHGEHPAAALARELAEELDIRAIIGGEIARYEYQYPGHAAILLIFYRVREFEGEPRNRAFEALAWESAARLPEYDFLEGDVEFVRALANAAAGTPRRVRRSSVAKGRGRLDRG
jgi:mutator protein MutT